MTFPTTGVLDDFNRANAGPPPSASWTSDLRSSGAPGLAIVSNAIKSAVSAEASVWWSAATFGDDNEVYVTVAAAPASIELWARGSAFSGGLPQAYVVWWQQSSSTVRIQKYGPGGVGGYVDLTGTAPFTLAAGDQLGLRVEGSRIEAWGCHVGGAWTLLAGVDDSTFAAGGSIGVITYGSGVILDDFGGGTLVPEPTPPDFSEPWDGCETMRFVAADGEEITFQMQTGVQGRIMPPVKVTTIATPGGDGGTLLGSAMLERVVAVPVAVPGVMTNREKLRAWPKVLDPRKGEGELRVVDGPWSGRFLRCVYEAGLDTLSEQQPNLGIGTLLFRAARPYWLDAVEESFVVSEGSTDVTFWFPFFPLVLGVSDAFANFAVTNFGDVEAWPVITVLGPGSDLTVQNQTTDKSFTVSGDVPDGSELVVNTGPGAKTVMLDGLSAFGSLTTGSKLWPLVPGSNRVQIALAGTTPDSLVTISWRKSWLAA